MSEQNLVCGRLSGLFGMAKRAGRLAAGFDASVGTLVTRKAYAIFRAADASDKTVKEISFALQRHGSTLSLGELPLTKRQLGDALGTPKPVGVVALTDKGFATAVGKLLDLPAD